MDLQQLGVSEQQPSRFIDLYECYPVLVSIASHKAPRADRREDLLSYAGLYKVLAPTAE